ncbi:hypothetical protein I4U23_023809 [Adineta vaga]|nr:hypothetical protein I4U23_023809 [Adineta vaga]
MFSKFFFILLLSALTVQNSHGWGIEGHTLIARLAQSQLTKEASDWIQYLLPSNLAGNLSAIATWADDVLYSNNNPLGPSNLWQWSRPLHYTNTPDWNCSYDPMRDCKNDICIEGALRNYSQRAIADDLDHIQHQHAIVFLVHYVGDIHQPLHAGFEGDAGASKLSVYFMNTKRTLHSVWDTHLIRMRLSRDFQSNLSLYYDYIYTLMLNRIPEQYDQDFIEWTDESSKIVCDRIYLDENNDTMNTSLTIRLSDRYYQRNIGIVEQRLMQAGRRLGTLFNLLAPNRSNISITTLSQNQSSSTAILSTFSSSESTKTSPTELSSIKTLSIELSSTKTSATVSLTTTTSSLMVPSSYKNISFDCLVIFITLCITFAIRALNFSIN